MKYKDDLSPTFHAFDFDKYPPSIANLSPGLTINGTTVYPTFRYKGGDAGASTWNPWGYGEVLTLQSGTAPTYKNGSPLLGKDDDSIKFNSGGYYNTATATGTNNIGVGDIVAELVCELTTNKSICGKYSASPGKWVIATNSSRYFQFYMANGSANATISSAAITASSIVYAIFFGDRSGSGQWYVNGVASGSAVDISSVAATLTGDHKFGLGTNDGNTGADAWGSRVMYLSVWERSAWLDTHLQPTIAAERFYRLTGLYPHQAKGTSAPTSYTRALAAYSDKTEVDGTTKLYYVESGWPRSCSRVDANGKLVKGLLIEGSAQNVALQTQTLGTTWTQADLTSITNNSANGPDGTATLDGLIGTAVNAQHGVTQAVTLTAATYCVSFYVKAGNKSWCYLINSTVVNCYCYFNISAGILGTKSGNVNSYGIISCGDGLYRIYFTFTGTAAAHTIGLYPASADLDNDFTGDAATINMHAGCAQVELGSYPSSYIPTTTAAVTRPADILYYSATSNIGTTKGQISCNVLLPNIDNTVGEPLLFLISDGSGSNFLSAQVSTPTNDYFTYINTVSSAQVVRIDTTTDAYSNILTNYRCVYQTNFAQILVNGTNEGTPDTSCAVPTGLTRIDIGAYLSGNAHYLNGLINNLKILPLLS